MGENEGMKFLLASLIVCCGVGITSTPGWTAQVTPVEVWHVGDDGLTQRLTDAIEKALKNSRQFNFSTGRRPGTLLLTIPTNVAWKQIGNRTQANYRVEFSTIERRQLGISTGVCWDDTLTGCAKKIV